MSSEPSPAASPPESSHFELHTSSFRHAKQTQFPDRGVPPYRHGQGRPTRRKTKPIAGPRENFHADTPNANRSCETNPISSGPGKGQVLNVKQTQFPGKKAPSTPTQPKLAYRAEQNPEFPDRGVPESVRSEATRRAKQSQFHDEGGLSPVPRRSCEGIISRPGVQNKAGMPWAEGPFRADTIRDGPSCETKPISGVPQPPAWHRPWQTKPIVGGFKFEVSRWKLPTQRLAAWAFERHFAKKRLAASLQTRLCHTKQSQLGVAQLALFGMAHPCLQ